MTVSRRRFLKNAAATGAAVTAGAMFPAVTSAAPIPVPTTWDKEADVVIIGYGGAGAYAGIAAADGGAKVLILEKQPEATHVSNTRMSGGLIHSPAKDGDKQALIAYAEAMFAGIGLKGKLEPEFDTVKARKFAEIWAEYTPNIIDWMKSIDPAFAPRPMGGAAFPMFPGATESKYRVHSPMWPNRKAASIPCYRSPKMEKGAGEAVYWFARERLAAQGVEIMYNAPGRDLIVNPAGEVIGVVAETNGRRINIKAKRSVIITSGGYEYSRILREAFLEGPGLEGWAFYGTTANEGDGIIMALKIGAAMEKASKAAARMIGAIPVRSNGLRMGIITDAVGRPNEVVVDNYGNRYAAETLIIDDPSRYFFYKEAVHFDILTLLYPRIPSWLIMDQKHMDSAPITNMGGGLVGYEIITWSQDNKEAVDRGWVIKADTLEELCRKINEHPDNRQLMTVENLESSIKRYNEGCEKGVDEFGRRTATLGPVSQAPFYAMALYAGGPNTKGGLLTNENRQVLGWNNQPIPRLFSAGEVSSVMKFVYQGGGNITECIVFGQVAGKEAAKVAPWS